MGIIRNCRESLGRVYRQEGEKKVFGRAIPAFLFMAWANDSWFLIQLRVYEDGVIEAGDWASMDLEELKRLVGNGHIVTSLPDNTEVKLDMLGEAKLFSFNSRVSEEELLEEIEDIIREFSTKMIIGTNEAL